MSASNDIIFDDNNTRHIVTNTEYMTYNGTDSTISTLQVNFTDAIVSHNVTEFSPYDIPYDTEPILGYISLAFVIFGLLGNILSIVVLTRPKNRKSSTATYFTALAISDNLILLNNPSNIFFIHVYKFDYRARVVFLCKVSIWVTYASLATSSWLLVAVTMERVISVIFPYRAKQLCTKYISKRIVIIIWCTIYTLDSHLLYGAGEEYSSSNTIVCGLMITPEYELFTQNYFSWIDMAMVFAIPFCFIFFGFMC